MITSMINGVLAYFRALSFIMDRGLGRYFLYSGLMGLVLFAGSILLILNVAPIVSTWLTEFIPWDFSMDFVVTKWISFLVSSVLFISTFKYLMLIITAPLMSALSEKVELEMTGELEERSVILNIIPDLIRGLRINLRNVIRELLLTLLILIFGFIPVVGIISSVLILLIQSYYAGFGVHDFWAERHFTYRGTVSFMKENKGMCIGNGMVFIFLLAIPILGAFIAPPLSTVAATMDGLKTLEQYD